jgi:talin
MGAFAQPSEYSSTAAVLGDAARQAQEPLLAAARTMVMNSCNLIGTAKALIANPKDAKQWQELATNSKAVSDSIKGLVRACVRVCVILW